MEKQLLIVGLDPGTTLGYAFLDIKGEVAEIGSSKNLDLNSIINTSLEQGKVVVVGTDKAKCPSLVERFATKLGARLVVPKQDLLVKDKKILTRKHKIKNEHELDALASAIFAYKKVRPLLKKVDYYLKRNKKQDITLKVKDLILTNEGLSINGAINLIEQPQRIEPKPETRIREFIPKTKDIKQLEESLTRLEKENRLLKQQNRNLLEDINKIRSRDKYLAKKLEQLMPSEKAERLLEQREKLIKEMHKEIIKKEQQIKETENRTELLNEFLSNLNNIVLVKKLANLGQKDFEAKQKIIRIQEGDILLVDDPNIISQEILNKIKEKVSIIINKKPVSKQNEEKIGLVFINAQNFKIKEDIYFAAIDKKEFEKEKSKSNVLITIIDKYKAGRKKD